MISPAPSKADLPADKEAHKHSNFLRQIIEKDLAEGTYANRTWGGSPGDAAHHAAGKPDTQKVRMMKLQHSAHRYQYNLSLNIRYRNNC